MNQVSILELFDECVTEISKKNSFELIESVKEQIESQSSPLVRGNFESFTIGIVIDANAAISAIERYVKNKSSILFHLGNNPIFSLYAPNVLKDEIIKYIKSDKVQKKSIKKWLEGLQAIEKIIKFKNNNNIKIKKQAIDIIGKKDPKDVPYVELYISVNAQAIFTSDKHFEHRNIQIFKISDLENVACIFQKGVLSHHIMDKSMQVMLDFLKNIIPAFFRKILHAIKHIFTTIKSKLSNVFLHIIEFIENLPNWQKFLIIGTIILLASIAIFFKPIRKKIIHTLGTMIDLTGDFINKMFRFIKKFIGGLINFVSYVAPHATIIIEPLNSLLKNIKNMESEFKDLVVENTIT